MHRRDARRPCWPLPSGSRASRRCCPRSIAPLHESGRNPGDWTALLPSSTTRFSPADSDAATSLVQPPTASRAARTLPAMRRRALRQPPQRCPRAASSHADGAATTRCACRDQRVVVGCVQERELRAALRGLTQTRGEQRMIATQERADDKRGVDVRQIRDLHAEPRRAYAHRRREIALTQTEIDVRRADRPRQLLQQIQFFDRAVRRSQRGNARSRRDRP